MLIVMGLGWAYVRYGKLPAAEAPLYGVKPVIIAVVVQALWSLGRTAIKDSLLGLVVVGAMAASFFGINELVVLFAAGALVATVRSVNQRRHHIPGVVLPLPLFAAAIPTATTAATTVSFGLLPLFLFFLKIGSVLYGSGYVLLAFLRSGLVERFGWLTETQLLDAVAVGQITPGPVFTTATFIGYILGGTPAALIATVGIFLPAFFFVAVSGPLVPRIRRSPMAGAFLDGVNAASLALMAVVTFQLGRAALVDWLAVLLTLTAAVLLLRWKLNSLWLVGGGALVGIVKVLA
jgi:chromate transporter